MVRKFDLNCDIGEGEPVTLTVGLTQWVSSVNIACGGHAGTIHYMRLCVGLARLGSVESSHKLVVPMD